MKPFCWNRDDYTNYLLQDGWEPGVTENGTETRHPRMIEYPFRLSKGCKAWVADPSTDPVPLQEGWPCETCRHFPADDVATAYANKVNRES